MNLTHLVKGPSYGDIFMVNVVRSNILVTSPDNKIVCKSVTSIHQVVHTNTYISYVDSYAFTYNLCLMKRPCSNTEYVYYKHRETVSDPL